jgi:hypothetical protein
MGREIIITTALGIKVTLKDVINAYKRKHPEKTDVKYGHEYDDPYYFDESPFAEFLSRCTQKYELGWVEVQAYDADSPEVDPVLCIYIWKQEPETLWSSTCSRTSINCGYSDVLKSISELSCNLEQFFDDIMLVKVNNSDLEIYTVATCI